MKVLTVGVFDYFHYGHLKLFERAKACGDYLVVAVQKTEEIHKTKPTAKVLYSLEQRMEILNAIKYIDLVVPYNQVAEDIEKIDFDVLVTGPDQTHAGFAYARQWCEDNGKKVIVLERTPNISSSSIKESLNNGDGK